MKTLHIATACLFVAWSGEAIASSRPALGVLPAYMRDYSFLASSAEHSDALDGLKYIPFGKTSDRYLSLSGEARLRYDDFSKNPGFGLTGLRADDYVFTRAAFGAELHLGQHLRAFAQLDYTGVDGKRGAIGQTDTSGTDWQQGFIELTTQAGKQTDIVARVGRQEVILGSQRLIALRDGPNLRQAFDGVRVIMKTAAYEVTAFAFHPIQLKQRDFDDVSDRSQDFYGVYATLPIPNTGAFLDAYALRLSRKDAAFAQGKGDERRDSFGVRLWGVRNNIDYNFETLYQSGAFDVKAIRAWTFASDTGYTAHNLLWSPRFSLKADIASGDKNGRDNELNTFNALFPKGGYFTENGLIGPSNIVDLQPGLTLNPSPTFNIMLSAVILWRDTTADAIYRQPNMPIPGTAGSPGKYTGTQYYLTPTWQINSHLLLSATYVHFAVGNPIKAVGGGDSDYASAWLTYRF
jgi:hypothetical protein